MDEPEVEAQQPPPAAEPDLYAVLGGASRGALAAPGGLPLRWWRGG